MMRLFEQAALAAGRAILDVCAAGPHVTLKSDASPVTEADQRAETIILAALAKAMPDVPVVAEEAVAAGNVPDTNGRSFLLVDPLDGTREFIAGRPEFTVNIALIEDGVPLAGIVYAPALGVAYLGSKAGAEKLTVSPNFEVTERHPITVRPCPSVPLAVASRSHNSPETERYLKDNGITEHCSIGSSLKFCLLAEGAADIYPRFSRTMEWDTAAGDAVLRAAGGATLCLDGRPLAYGKRHQLSDVDFANPFFIAHGADAKASCSASGADSVAP
ncbi:MULTISPECIES: 3'(2'),5'-bisphosphate nucleotidase CysQ [Alphaproteobacteria]|uniref:3'(2'),5'-bisphosphate nucleotidase CysQ n=2 Tax=Alphaproteobacteria TaxID=28211 RepID=A0A512HJF0_9HYPH|nr:MULTISPECIES: 3'(2'),5'-bisphosphate nucleotidase CysQ [Alphaproteobacteria]GEO85561.1 3'(2'),5'-bisphosphate nucleotidase CysQ [Ciceribacter naphthalenivorans]GLR22084.1 3'(2'),5'-bisphosphate nucleotidase CysQ [Ciceribacter naphthalenivorans]GLT04940.1 3'(2'),5'-bisphosphate nucleotidase CysQ [Sphingomonas psychrolutea]